MQISNITKKISLALFALFLAFSFFNTSFAVTPPPSETWSFHWKSHPPALLSEGQPTFPIEAWCTTAQQAKEADGFDIISPCALQLNGGAEASAPAETKYSWLAKLPGFDDSGFDPAKKCSFVDYLNIMIKLLIGIGAVLAMVMIVMGGMEYMTSELISSKEAGKSRIMNAMLGLVIALSSYLILNTLNPDLLNLCLDKLPTANITISPDDTSTGSRTGPGLCIDANAPNPNTATGTNITPNSTITTKYIPALNSIPNLSKGAKLLMIAQTVHEGFSATPAPGTLSYRTNNPGNIGNTDDGTTKSFTTISEGAKAQQGIVTRVANGSSKSYKIGSKPTCALGDEAYTGALYQYLRIYSTGARDSNSYLNSIIGYFAQNGVTITPNTTMAQIYAIN